MRVQMKLFLAGICSLLAIPLPSYSATSLSAAQSTCALPDTLTHGLDVKFPDMHVVSLADLKNKDDQQQFQKEHRDGCPGLVHLDFYGSGHDVIAMSLVSNLQRRPARLVVATMAEGKWKITLVDSAKTNTPVVWSEQPDRYPDVQGNGSITARNPVIVWCAFDSWAIAYAWTGSSISKVWLAD